MCHLLKHIVWLVLVSLSSSTDLLAVYQHDILLLRNVDRIAPSEPLSWKSLVHPLPKQLVFPVSLASDPDTNRIFVSEAFPDEEEKGKIFSVSMDKDYAVESMATAVKSAHMTFDEGMSYNPNSRELFWTDSLNDLINKATIPEKLDDTSSVTAQSMKRHGVMKKPRGLAIDICNEWLFWSEQGQSRKYPSTIEMSDLSGKRHQVLEQHQENEYFQGLFYDAAKESLVIGVTLGKEANTSSCRFTRRSVNGEQSQDLLSLDNCYPFSLSIEQDMLYWADWARQGIMRANISDPKSVVKLVDTPAIVDNHGMHSGVYGLILKNKAHIPSDACQALNDRKKIPGSIEIVEPEAEKGTDNSSMPADVVEYEKFVEKNGAVTVATHKETAGTLSEKIVASHGSTAEGTKEQNHFSEKKESLEVESGETHSNEETEHEMKDGLSFSEKISDLAEGDRTGSDHESPTVHTYPETLENMLHPAYDNNSMIGTRICTGNERQLKIVILVLALLWVIFMASTAVLARLYYLRRNCGATQVTVPHPRQVKRFGPKKQFNSGNKSVVNGVSPCSGLGSGDGVTINIEDCCQMTLCETPCYTSVKKERKSYKTNVANTKSCEDKKSLLDDCEEACDTS